MTELEKILVAYFKHQGWNIETDDGRLEAEMSSDYGSGPAVVDLRDLAKSITDHVRFPEKTYPTSYIAIRDVELTECPWLDPAIKKGEIVYAFTGHVYGLTRAGYIGERLKYVSPIVVTRDANGGLPFFELPLEALHKINQE